MKKTLTEQRQVATVNALIIAILGCFMAASLQAQQATDLTNTLPDAGKLTDGNPVGSGWVSLIEKPDDWIFDKTYWSMKDGIVHGDYQGGKPHEHMWTKTQYSDFRLHAVFRMTGDEKANSGVCIRLNPTSADDAPGYQVDTGAGYWGCLWEQGGDKMVQEFPQPLAEKLVKRNDWNHYFVIARGHHIQAWLNGVKTIDVVHEKGFLKGSFGFQLAHGKRHTILDVKTLLMQPLAESQEQIAPPRELLKQYCFDCHDGATGEGGFDFVGSLRNEKFDGTLVFENLITAKMPPADMDQPSSAEKRSILQWLAEQKKETAPQSYRRISRREFVHSVNDLLGTKLDLADKIPEDRGTRDFDSDRRIKLSREMLGSYFAVADEMLEFAFPNDGFPVEQTWVTSKLKDSHETYNIYVRDYEKGVLFSWTRANNGNSYSFFYDNFDPPASGWYELTFDAMKVGEFKEDVAVQVHAGKYYYADDRPQPQRLLDVISVGNRELKSHSLRVFLNPGENVSVHCYSKHTFRKKNTTQGAYIKQLKVRGPLQDQWPPTRFQKVFGDLPVDAPAHKTIKSADFQTNLNRIGGSISVSSFQKGMEKEKLQDGSNRTFWHTRFKPTLAQPPHFVILENPSRAEIKGLSYATWSGGNGNGQVKAYSVHVSDDAATWSDPIAQGELEVKLANEQSIHFPMRTNKRFIKFLVLDAVEMDGKSLASIGKLDVLISSTNEHPKTRVSIETNSPIELKQAIKRFAERAFSTSLSDIELAPYLSVGLSNHKSHGDFVQAAKVAFKAIVCSPRFLMAPGEHANPSYSKAADLARILWLSVPDDELNRLSTSGLNALTGQAFKNQIDRMIADAKSDRMIESFCAQWLNLRTWNNVTPSLKLYPKYDDLLNHYLPIEAESYLAHLIRENMPVSHLIDSDYTFLNQRLAQHYEIDGVIGQRIRKVSFAPDVPRGGLLTMGSVLKVTTDGFDTSPILRGAWISKNIVGTPISPPPESVTAIEREHGDSAATLREQIEQHKINNACYACHKSIDPYGFALENFDATGQWRTKYRVLNSHKGTFQFRLRGYYHLAQDVDAAGEIGDSKFEDVDGLKKVLLSDHRKIAYNFAKKFFEYANGYQPSLKQRVALLDMIAEDPNDCRIKDLVIGVLVYSMGE